MLKFYQACFQPQLWLWKLEWLHCILWQGSLAGLCSENPNIWNLLWSSVCQFRQIQRESVLVRVPSSLSQGTSCMTRGTTCMSRGTTCMSRGTTCMSQGTTYILQGTTCMSRGTTCMSQDTTCMSRGTTCMSQHMHLRTCIHNTHPAYVGKCRADDSDVIPCCWYNYLIETQRQIKDNFMKGLVQVLLIFNSSPLVCMYISNYILVKLNCNSPRHTYFLSCTLTKDLSLPNCDSHFTFWSTWDLQGITYI